MEVISCMIKCLAIGTALIIHRLLNLILMSPFGRPTPTNMYLCIYEISFGVRLLDLIKFSICIYI